MRDIKFRAWLKEEKIMIDVSEINFHGEEVSGFDESDVFYEGYGYDYAELMRFTGLKDKNDDEIYSGHIVNFLGIVGEIVFDSGAFGIVLDCIDWDLVGHEMRKYTGCNNPLYFCCNDNFISLWEIYWNFNEEENSLGIIEIIGNIYENPELREANNENNNN